MEVARERRPTDSDGAQRHTRRPVRCLRKGPVTRNVADVEDLLEVSPLARQGPGQKSL